MGVKCGLLAYADGSVGEALRGVTAVAPDRTAALVSRLRPGQRVTADDSPPWALAESTYPPDGTVHALSAPGVDLVTDKAVMIDRPSELPAHLVAESRGRRLCLLAMHSVVDWLAFAVWEDTRLVRSLSVSPDDGVIEDVGERLPCEVPYWDGRFPLDDPDDDDDPYPLVFHPLELGERVMQELFGFHITGFRTLDDEQVDPLVDPWKVLMPAFTVGE